MRRDEWAGPGAVTHSTEDRGRWSQHFVDLIKHPSKDGGACGDESHRPTGTPTSTTSSETLKEDRLLLAGRTTLRKLVTPNRGAPDTPSLWVRGCRVSGTAEKGAPEVASGPTIPLLRVAGRSGDRGTEGEPAEPDEEGSPTHTDTMVLAGSLLRRGRPQTGCGWEHPGEKPGSGARLEGAGGRRRNPRGTGNP